MIWYVVYCIMAVKTPTITVNGTLQREKCTMIRLTYQDTCKQPDQLIGKPHYKYLPGKLKLFWEMETVYSDVYQR